MNCKSLPASLADVRRPGLIALVVRGFVISFSAEAQHGDELEQLVAASSHRNRAVRIRAIERLGRLGDSGDLISCRRPIARRDFRVRHPETSHQL